MTTNKSAEHTAESNLESLRESLCASFSPGSGEPLPGLTPNPEAAKVTRLFGSLMLSGMLTMSTADVEHAYAYWQSMFADSSNLTPEQRAPFLAGLAAARKIILDAITKEHNDA